MTTTPDTGQQARRLLERRYRALLRCYPAAYQRDRADEIVTTLLEGARPGQRHPAPREAVALAVGGLRVRTGAPGHGGVGAVWTGALRLAVPLLLGYGAAVMFAESMPLIGMLVRRPRLAPLVALPGLVAAVLICLGLVAVAAGRRGIALALLVPAIVLPFFGSGVSGAHASVQVALAVILVLASWRRPALPFRHAWWWLLAVPATLLVLPTQFPAMLASPSRVSWAGAFYGYQFWWIVGGLAACLLWIAVDARVPIVAGLAVLSFGLPALAEWVVVVAGGRGTLEVWPASVGVLLWCGLPALPLAAGALRANQQARL